MRGGTSAVKNTLFDGYEGPRLPRQVQLKRIRRVMEAELTERQRQTLAAYYFRQLTIPEIALEQGVNKSTVSRTIRRAEARLRKFLKY